MISVCKGMAYLGHKSSISLVTVPNPWQEGSSRAIERQGPCSALWINVSKASIHCTALTCGESPRDEGFWIQPCGQHFLSVSLEHPPADSIITRCSLSRLLFS